ncbi:predicted protein [Nematostella vectensis]|uniref:dolichyl-phosphate-mannose--protein mannosyltransferase n=1 Tax=Nematostella vectensis TaxID=45351 RepID=A7S9A3_NEMVE|nr:predicted protein [Nematostella vectensis]|eukprot:XP_001631810.1 predicted protein [Nematostella vectensis]
MDSRKWSWWHTAIISSVLGISCYLNTLDAEFVYDDSRAILKNADLLPTTPWINLLFNDFWGTPLTHSGSHKSYRPICIASFRLNYAIGELNPGGYHLVNTLLHGMVCWLTVVLSYNLVDSHVVGVVGGLLFATHPIHTGKAVAGVVGRADVGACLFLIASFLCYIKSCAHPLTVGSRHTRLRWLLGSLVLAALSMLCKEQGVTVLGVCAVHEVVYVSKLNGKTLRSSVNKALHRGMATRLLSLAVTAICLIVLRMFLMGNSPPEFSPSDNPASSSESFLTRTLTFLYLPAFNFLLLLYPRTLSFDWSMEAIPLIENVLDVRNVLTVTFYVCFISLGLYSLRRTIFEDASQPEENGKDNNFNSYKNGSITSKATASRNNTNGHLKKRSVSRHKDHRRSDKRTVIDETAEERPLFCFPVIVTSLAIIVLPFVPASNVFFYVGFVVAERVLYIPSVGFCIMVGVGVGGMWSRFSNSGRRVVLVVVGVVVVLFAAKTMQRNLDWKNEEALYRSGIDVNPAKAWGNLGNVLGNQGRTNEAEMAYRKALSYRSNMADTHYNLGILLAGQKRYKDAIQSYENAITFRPRLAVAHLNLGIVLDQVGRKEDAIRILKNASTISGHGLKDPKQHSHAIASIKYNLGRILTDLGRIEEGLTVYQDVVRTRPAHFEPHSLYNMIGEAYTKAGLLDEAEKWYKRSLESKPSHVPAHLTLAKLYSKTGRTKQAEALFLKAQSLGPRDVSVWTHYGQHLYEGKQVARAAEMFVKASKLAPDDFDIVFNAANYLRESESYETAEEFYRSAVKLDQKSNIAHMNLGAILHLLGKHQESERYYLTALELNPGDTMTRENLRKLRAIMAKKQARR